MRCSRAGLQRYEEEAPRQYAQKARSSRRTHARCQPNSESRNFACWSFARDPAYTFAVESLLMSFFTIASSLSSNSKLAVRGL